MRAPITPEWLPFAVYLYPVYPAGQLLPGYARHTVNSRYRFRQPQGVTIVTEQATPAPAAAPILATAEVTRRMLLLGELQEALAALGVRSVLARNHRLVLQYNRVPYGPCGMTDPQLHVFTPDGTCVATTDGTTFHLASGRQCPADDPAAAATFVRHGVHAQCEPDPSCSEMAPDNR